MWDQTSEQFSDAAHKVSQAASVVTDALEDGVASVRLAARRGGDAAAELLNDTKKRVQQHPVETVAATFAAGIATGVAIGWLMRRRSLEQSGAARNGRDR
jgi:ElaB/YqjD/DUF883 family membrane-anchored ribosome-binding protein